MSAVSETSFESSSLYVFSASSEYAFCITASSTVYSLGRYPPSVSSIITVFDAPAYVKVSSYFPTARSAENGTSVRT